ncbi:MAG: PKD domain-containing protein [Chitinophagaceae bacterium]
MKLNIYHLVFLIFLVVLSCTKVVNYSTNSTGSGTSNGSGSGSGSNNGGGGGTSNPAKPSYTPPTNGNPDTSKGGIVSGNIDSLQLTAISVTPCASDSDVVQFTLSAKNIPAGSTYEWYFGDGNFTKAGRLVEFNTYKKAGNYTITAKINNNGQNIASITKGISTNAGNGSGLTSTFTYLLLNPLVGNNYAFTNTATIKSGKIVKFVWDFGDGRKDSSASYILHSYAQTNANQTFTVRLTTISELGCTSTTTQTVGVLPK